MDMTSTYTSAWSSESSIVEGRMENAAAGRKLPLPLPVVGANLEDQHGTADAAEASNRVGLPMGDPQKDSWIIQPIYSIIQQ